MKRLLTIGLVGASLFFFNACNDTPATGENAKCQSGKCSTGKCSNAPKAAKCQSGKCGSK